MMNMKKNLLQKRREDMTTVLVSGSVFGFVLESSAKSSSKEYSTLLDAHIAMAQAAANRTMTTKYIPTTTTITDTITDLTTKDTTTGKMATRTKRKTLMRKTLMITIYGPKSMIKPNLKWSKKIQPKLSPQKVQKKI